MPSCPQITRPSQVLLGWGIYRNAPRNVPSPSPQQLLAQCRWPAAPQPAPGPAGTYPPGCWQSCPPFLLPPCSQCPMPTVGPGWGRVTSAVEPARQAQAPPSYRESPRPCSQAVASRGSTWASQAQSEAGSWGPPGEQLLPAPRAEVGARSPSGPRHWPARIPPAQGFARAPESP